MTRKEDYLRFINQFKKIVEANGKRMIGWEEIGQAQLDSNDIAQVWKNPKYAMMAAENGAGIVMSPSKKVYLDMKYDSTTKLGLKWAAYIEIKDSYDWDPASIVDGLDEKKILGIEAPLWGETILTMKDIEYLLFPRLPGIAELGWSQVTGRNWDQYKGRLGYHAKRMNAMGINYYRSPQIEWKK